MIASLKALPRAGRRDHCGSSFQRRARRRHTLRGQKKPSYFKLMRSKCGAGDQGRQPVEACNAQKPDHIEPLTPSGQATHCILPRVSTKKSAGKPAPKLGFLLVAAPRGQRRQALTATGSPCPRGLPRLGTAIAMIPTSHPQKLIEPVSAPRSIACMSRSPKRDGTADAPPSLSKGRLRWS